MSESTPQPIDRVRRQAEHDGVYDQSPQADLGGGTYDSWHQGRREQAEQARQLARDYYEHQFNQTGQSSQGFEPVVPSYVRRQAEAMADDALSDRDFSESHLAAIRRARHERQQPAEPTMSEADRQLLTPSRDDILARNALIRQAIQRGDESVSYQPTLAEGLED